MSTRRKPQQPAQPIAPDPPAGLSDRAAALWAAVVTAQTSLARRAAVEEALRNLDRAGEAAAVLAGEGMTVAPADGKGMPHPHPMLRVERDCREAFLRAWKLLRLTF